MERLAGRGREGKPIDVHGAGVEDHFYFVNAHAHRERGARCRLPCVPAAGVAQRKRAADLRAIDENPDNARASNRGSKIHFEFVVTDAPATNGVFQPFAGGSPTHHVTGAACADIDGIRPILPAVVGRVGVVKIDAFVARGNGVSPDD